MKQLSLFKPKVPRPRQAKFHRPLKGGPQCQNMLRKRELAGHHYFWKTSEQCPHRGRNYMVNGYRMILCACCARRLYAKTSYVVKEVRHGGAAPTSL